MLVAIVTPLFPRPDDPHSGWFVYQTVAALQRYTDLKVVCPEPSYQPKGIVKAGYQEPAITPIRFAFPAVKLLTRPFNGITCARKLYPILRDLRPDLVLNYWLYPEGYAAVQAAHRLKLPVIVESMGSDLRRISDPFTRKLVGQTVQRADYVLTVSEDLRQFAIRMGAQEANTRTILNGCDPQLFQYGSQADARRELKIADDSELIVYVGRFVKTKGLMELSQAFVRLAAERPKAQLALVGYGPFEAPMMALLREHGLEKRVLTPGRQDSHQIARWLHAASLFCLPSYSEGCPNVVVESTACGCPVIATSVGGIPELVDADSSILVPPMDSDALFRALRDGLGRTWDRAAIAASKGRTWDDVARETWEVCQQVHARFAATVH